MKIFIEPFDAETETQALAIAARAIRAQFLPIAQAQAGREGQRYYAGIGHRATPIEIIHQMETIAGLARKNGWILRSGAAIGADQAFESEAGEAKQIFLPWPNFNDSISLDTAPGEVAHEIAAKFDPRWRRRSSSEKALLARNAQIILGKNLDDPVECVVCYCERDLSGTGHSLRIARANGIPVFNLNYEGEQELAEKFLSSAMGTGNAPVR